MRAFRLICDTEDNDIIFGIDNFSNNAVLKKLNNGLSKIRPYEQLVPFYKNSKFAFSSLESFKFFLFHLCKFSFFDLIELEDLGFAFIDEDLEGYAKGLSKILCTYFDDEVNNFKKESLTDFFATADSREYEIIKIGPYPKEDIKACKAQFYQNVKFKK